MKLNGLEKFKRKLYIESIIKSILFAIAISLAIEAGYLLLCKLIPLKIIVWTHVLVSILSFITFSCILSKLMLPSEEKIAKRLDKEIKLDERVKTMIEFKDKEGSIIELQRADTVKCLESKSTKDCRFKLSYISIIICLLAIGGLVTSAVIPQKPFPVQANDENISESESNQESQDSSSQESGSDSQENSSSQENGSDINQTIDDLMEQIKDQIDQDENLSDEEKEQLKQEMDDLGNDLKQDETQEDMEQDISDAQQDISDSNLTDENKDSINQQLEDLKDQIEQAQQGEGDSQEGEGEGSDSSDQSGENQGDSSDDTEGENGSNGQNAGSGSGNEIYASNDLVYDYNTNTYVTYGELLNTYYSDILEGIVDGTISEETQKVLYEYFSSLYSEDNTDGNK